jgi:cyanate permease
LGWKMFLSVLGVIPLLLAFIWLFISQETDRTNISNSNTMNLVSGNTLMAVFKYKTTYLLALAYSGPVALLLTAGSWLPTYYNEVFQLPMAKASNIVGMLNFVGIAAAICGMVLPAKVGLRRPFFIVPGFIVGIAGLGSILINNLPVIYISTMLLGACIWVFLPSLITLPMELPGMDPKQVAMIVGVVFAIGNAFGFIAPIIVGYLRDATGSYLPGLFLWSIISFSLAISGLLLPETGPKGQKTVVRPNN